MKVSLSSKNHFKSQKSLCVFLLNSHSHSQASSDKRSVESSVHTMHAELDEMLQQAKNSEEKAKKAMMDGARLADELRAEQDHTRFGNFKIKKTPNRGHQGPGQGQESS